MTVHNALKLSEVRLEAAGIESFKTEAKQLLAALLEIPLGELVLKRTELLTSEQEKTFEMWLERRASREPLQHILGVAPFYGLELKVTPAVLVPRPETERLTELVLDAVKEISSPKILDVGTGSGAIALALKHERPDAVVLATDISEDAVKVAEGNARRLGLKITFALSNLLTALAVQTFAKEADALVSNLPYLPESDRDLVSPEVQRDPVTALYSGEDGLEHFRRLERQAFSLLKPGALCLLELDERNVQRAAELAERWSKVEVLEDLTGRERFLSLRR